MSGNYWFSGTFRRRGVGFCHPIKLLPAYQDITWITAGMKKKC